jgi:hypothetical protein
MLIAVVLIVPAFADVEEVGVTGRWSARPRAANIVRSDFLVSGSSWSIWLIGTGAGLSLPRQHEHLEAGVKAIAIPKYACDSWVCVHTGEEVLLTNASFACCRKRPVLISNN